MEKHIGSQIFDEIEESIRIELNKIVQGNLTESIGSDGNWTKKIKQVFKNLGESKDFDVRTTISVDTRDDDYSEFLYDLVWTKDGKNGLIESVPLVVESEWSKNFYEIEKDFRKLLFSNSKHKLMICQPKPDEREKCKTHFIDAVNSYRHLKEGDRFLIATYEGYKFEYLLIIKK